MATTMKRKASRAPPFQPPAKLNKRSTSATVSRQANLSPNPAPRQYAPPTTSPRPDPAISRPRPVPPPRRAPSLPLPKWPTLVPTNRPPRKAESKAATAAPPLLSKSSDVSETMATTMKRKASRAPPFQPPAKLNKRSTSATVSRQANLSPNPSPRQYAPPTTSPRPHPATSRPRPVPPPRRAPSLPLPKWPTLVPTNRPPRKAESKAATATPLHLSVSSGVSEVSEERTVVTPSLRRLSTLPLDDGESGAWVSEGLPTSAKMARSSSAAKKEGSRLEKKGSKATLGRTATTPLLAAPSSVTKSASLTKPTSFSRSASKSTSLTGSAPVFAFLAKSRRPVKAISSIRVIGTDEPPTDEDDDHALPLGSRSSSHAPDAPPPGSLIEMALIIPSVHEQRERVGDIIGRLQAERPDVRVAEITHRRNQNGTKHDVECIDFGAPAHEKSHFVSDAQGVDAEKLLLSRARTELSWTPGSKRCLLLVGDPTTTLASPQKMRTRKRNWEQEANSMANAGIKVYTFQTSSSSKDTRLYNTMAINSGGNHFKVNQSKHIADIIKAIYYNEKGAEFVKVYEQEVRVRVGTRGMPAALEDVFSIFRMGTPTTTIMSAATAGKVKVKVKTATAKVKTSPPKKKGAVSMAKGKTIAGKGKVKAMAEKGKVKATAGKGKVKATAGKGKVTATAGKDKVKATVGKGKVKTTAGKGKMKAAVEKSKVKATAEKGKGKATAGKSKVKATAGKSKVKATAGKAKGKATPGKGTMKITKASVKTTANKDKVKATRAKVKAAEMKAKGKGTKVVKGKKPSKSIKGKR